MINLTKHQLPRKRMFKLLIKLFPLFLLLFLVSNCTEEYIDIQDESLQKGSLFKNELSQKQRIIELAEGIKPKIKDYNNQYKKPKKFQRKYGKLDTDNIKIINLPQFNDDLLIIIPFKNNQKKFKKNNEKKEKLFIAYYKDGKKTYTVLRNKNYKKKLRSSTEEGFLTHLEIMFKYVYGNIPPGVNKTLAMKTEYCPWITLMIDQKTCTALEFNKCTGLYRTVDLVEDGWDCNAEELEEIELDVPETCPDGYEENDYGVCVPKKNTGDPDKDPDKDPDDDCDDLAFDCDKGGGGDDPGVNDCPSGQSPNKDGECVGDCDTSGDDLKKVFPNTSDTKLTEIANIINKYDQDFGIDSKEKLQHFLSQAGHESANFTSFKENLNYRWKNLGTDYWEKYFNPASNPTEDPDKKNPNDYKSSEISVYVNTEKFANYVYDDNNRSSKSALGNIAKGDGYKYRGRGIFQLTGKYNYEQFTTFYQENYDANKDFITNPGLVATDTKVAVISALWFFKNKVQDKISIDSDTTVKEVTKKINGGTNGITDREELHTKTKTNVDCL